jgi:hypothetical protein
MHITYESFIERFHTAFIIGCEGLTKRYASYEKGNEKIYKLLIKIMIFQGGWSNLSTEITGSMWSVETVK